MRYDPRSNKHKIVFFPTNGNASGTAGGDVKGRGKRKPKGKSANQKTNDFPWNATRITMIAKATRTIVATVMAVTITTAINHSNSRNHNHGTHEQVEWLNLDRENVYLGDASYGPDRREEQSDWRWSIGDGFEGNYNLTYLN